MPVPYLPGAEKRLYTPAGALYSAKYCPCSHPPHLLLYRRRAGLGCVRGVGLETPSNRARVVGFVFDSFFIQSCGTPRHGPCTLNRLVSTVVFCSLKEHKQSTYAIMNVSMKELRLFCSTSSRTSPNSRISSVAISPHTVAPLKIRT